MTRNELYDLWGNPRAVVVSFGPGVPMRDKTCAVTECRAPLKQTQMVFSIRLKDAQHFVCGKCVSQGQVRV